MLVRKKFINVIIIAASRQYIIMAETCVRVAWIVEQEIKL